MASSPTNISSNETKRQYGALARVTMLASTYPAGFQSTNNKHTISVFADCQQVSVSSAAAADRPSWPANNGNQ